MCIIIHFVLLLGGLSPTGKNRILPSASLVNKLFKKKEKKSKKSTNNQMTAPNAPKINDRIKVDKYINN